MISQGNRFNPAHCYYQLLSPSTRENQQPTFLILNLGHKTSGASTLTANHAPTTRTTTISTATTTLPLTVTFVKFRVMKFVTVESLFIFLKIITSCELIFLKILFPVLPYPALIQPLRTLHGCLILVLHTIKPLLIMSIIMVDHIKCCLEMVHLCLFPISATQTLTPPFVL